MSASAPRVLHVAQPTEAGVQRYVVAAASAQHGRGWEVVVASPDGGQLSTDVLDSGLEWRRWHAVRQPGLSLPDEVHGLREVVRSVAPDVVHLHSSKAGLAGRLALRGSVPTIFQPHGWSWLAATGVQSSVARLWERWAVRWTSALVCVGNGEAEQGRAARLSNPLVVRSGVDLDRFAPADEHTRIWARALLGVDPEVPVVLCPGRATQQKGHDVLISAWPVVRRSCPGAELIMMGDGHPSAPTPTADGVRFLSAARDIRPYYAAADVVALPSRWEGFALTAVESLASGRPLVASDVPGLTEVMAAGCGDLVPPEDPQALARALIVRLQDPERARAEGRRAAAHAMAFDVADTHRELADLTLGLIREPHRSIRHPHTDRRA